VKSAALSTGDAVELSQFALGSPERNFCRKHTTSDALSTGEPTLPSQFA
jgi:hypothetical protein